MYTKLGSIADGATDRARALIGGRYELVNKIRDGGMGVVYRALDRSSGEIIALKLVQAVELSEVDTDPATVRRRREALAHEFEIMVSLHHPNILGVTDYGFDDHYGPYLATNLLPGAQTIVAAAAGRPLAIQANLIIQLLRAVAYLHSRSILHRDLKPANVLVLNDQVKVLDFGVAMLLEQSHDEVRVLGTLAYIAPEILQGKAPASIASDLYAVGLMACEILTGSYPFTAKDDKELQLQIIHHSVEPQLTSGSVRLAEVISTLIAKRADRRPKSAADTIEAIAAALNIEAPKETLETREGRLQTTPFVGRREEFRSLIEALEECRFGRGSFWLIGGESGAGKSRLADQLRIAALIRGTVVLQGRAVSTGGSPYEIWRDVLRRIALLTSLSDLECSVLRTLVPDIAELLRRDVPQPPMLDERAAQTRLLIVIETILRKMSAPILIVLDDLQWAGSESLQLLTWAARIAGEVPILIVGTYRDDEAHELAASFQAARTITLRRLPRENVEEIAESIMGATGRDPRLIDLLMRETEGNPFFLIEVLRSLAESGDLAAFAQRADAAEGVRRFVQRRLSRLPARARDILQTAAVIGRELDHRLLEHLFGAVEVEETLRQAIAARVLEATAGVWLFAHDKLREELLRTIDIVEHRKIHRAVAEAVAVVHDGNPEYLAALAYHWTEAEDASRAAHYCELAGRQALSSGANAEAVRFFERALELADRAGTPTTPQQLSVLQASLMEARYRLGELAAARAHAERALFHGGDAMPVTRGQWVRTVSREILLRCVQSIKSPRPEEITAEERVALSRNVRIYVLLSEMYLYSLDAFELALSSIRLTNRCAPAGRSPQLARAMLSMGIMASTTPFVRLAQRWIRNAVNMAKETGAPADIAYVINRAAVFDISCAQWSTARERIALSQQIAQKEGDRRLDEECSSMLGMVAFYESCFDEAEQHWERAFRLATHSGNLQIQRWGCFGRADQLVRRGRGADAVALYDEALDGVGETASELVWGRGMRALALLEAGDQERAYHEARLVLELLDRKRPCAYWTIHGAAAATEVLVRGLKAVKNKDQEAFARAGRAVRHLSRLARIAPMALSQWALWRGALLAATNARARAVFAWKRAVKITEHNEMRFEEAMARWWLANTRGVGSEELAQNARAILISLGVSGPLRVEEFR